MQTSDIDGLYDEIENMRPAHKAGLVVGVEVEFDAPLAGNETLRHQPTAEAALDQLGKFLLGLGTQVRGHITRRFSTEWGSPGPRLKDYIESMRANWDSLGSTS